MRRTVGRADPVEVELRAARSELANGRADAAAARALLVCERYPSEATAWDLLGRSRLALGDWESAAGAFESALHLRPDDREIAGALAAALRRGQRLIEAERVLRAALAGAPAAPRLHFQLALLHEAAGRDSEALESYREALNGHPEYAEALINLAALLARLGRPAEALVPAHRAVAVAPNVVAARVNLASALGECRLYAEAAEVYRGVAALVPGDLSLCLDAAGCEFLSGDVPRAIATLRTVLAADRHYVEAHSLLLLALSHVSVDAAALEQAHREFSIAAGAERRGARPVRRGRRGGALRVGLVSGDFRTHSVWYFLAPLLDRLPAQGVSLHCYHTDRRADETTRLWRERADDFVEAAALTDEQLASRIMRDEVDVLVSLGGHTTGGRPQLFARRIAPVQAGFLGYPGPTGIATMDYRLTDSIVDPIEEDVGGDRERPLRLPNSYFCFRPMAEQPAGYTGRLVDAPLTLGSFNALPKLTDTTLNLWSRLLAALPAARLVIKAGGLRSEGARAMLIARLARAGADPARIELRDWAPTREQHLLGYAEIDVALDTFPYNGATTTCEALWMGVPVISLVGTTPASRMGRSILSAAGCAGWACASHDAWVECAAAVAQDRQQLRATRDSLRERLRHSALLDEAEYASSFVAALRAASDAAG